MAGSSLFALIDDIASILDDVAVMTKVAAKKTAGVLGDDLALNAEQVSGVKADRELPVVWAVAKGSALNKLILVPAALAISALFPLWVTTSLLMLGGAFLCFEGFEKVLHKWLHSRADDALDHVKHTQANADANVDLVAFEKEKIKGAIRTDFVLSAEIIVITLGTVAATAFLNKVLVLTVIAVAMTVGVYGFVAAIVKFDDLGLWLLQSQRNAAKMMGRAIIAFAPKLMKSLTVIGTIAMFLVGGSIIGHGIPPLHHWLEALVQGISNPIFKAVVPTLVDGFVGVVAGAFVFIGVKLFGIVLGNRLKSSA